MLVIEHGNAATILPKNIYDLLEKFIARIQFLANLIFRVVTMLADHQHRIDCQAFATTTQCFSNRGILRESKLLRSRAAKVCFTLLIHIDRNDVQRWAVLATLAGIPYQEPFCHVPGMRVISPAGGDNGYSLSPWCSQRRTTCPSSQRATHGTEKSTPFHRWYFHFVYHCCCQLQKQAVNPFPGLSPNSVLCTTAGLPMQHFFCVLRLPPTVFVFRNRIKDVKF